MMKNRLLPIVLLVGGLPAAGYAQEPAVSPPTKFEITDNSFFVEEAFNQDRGIFQNIFSWARDGSGNWNASFTQEWPAPGVTHQLSYTVPFAGGRSEEHTS